MAVLSIDLAHMSYADVGAAILQESADGESKCNLFDIALTGKPQPEDLADYLHNICSEKRIRVLLIDGPQAWMSTESGLNDKRHCEKQLNTPAKTGLPYVVKPRPYTAFVKFSVDLHDRLASLGWERLSNYREEPGPMSRLLVETFPRHAWKALGIQPLPSKRRCKTERLVSAVAQLKELFPLRVSQTPNHDQLQALVAGIAGLAIEKGQWDLCEIAGVAPTLEEGVWREGFIVSRSVANKHR
jgi:Protein of unknown function (DUF429)